MMPIAPLSHRLAQAGPAPCHCKHNPNLKEWVLCEPRTSHPSSAPERCLKEVGASRAYSPNPRHPTQGTQCPCANLRSHEQVRGVGGWVVDFDALH